MTTSVTNERRFEYAPQPGLIFIIIALFGACTAAFGYMATTNDRGLTLNGILEFGPGGATTFFWVLTALSAAFVAIGVWGLSQRFTAGKTELRLGAEAFTVPKSGFLPERIVRYTDVRSIKEQVVSGTITVTYETAEFKAHVTNRRFRSQDEFREARALIQQRIEA